MSLNALTVRKLIAKRKQQEEAAVMNKPVATPTVWELHRGILDYRSGAWISNHRVWQYATHSEAKRALNFVADPWPDNAAYIVRRYRHDNTKETETY